MQVLKGDFQVTELVVPPAVMTLGNFDGVHKGHQYLIDHVRASADQLGIPALVLTFSPHPSHIIPGAKPSPLLFSQSDQQQEIAKRGVDFLVVQKFYEAFSQLKGEDFLRQYLFPKFRPKKVILGHDFSFGRGQEGSFELFREVAKDWSCEVQQVDAFRVEDTLVSSSKVRQAIKEGQMKLVQKWLERPFYIQSVIGKGKQLRRKMGFPTANLQGPFSLLPMDGVYLGRAHILEQVHWAVTNIGVRPTVDGSGERTVECHILDFVGDIYNTQLKFEFYERLREEKKFSDLEELKNQIAQDVECARSLVVEYGKTH